MDPGRLRHRITIQKQVTGRDEYGNPVSGWEDHATVWAQASALSQKEYWAAAQVQAEKTMRFIIRYQPGLDPTMRVLFRDQILDIRSIIDPTEQGRTLVLLCSEPDKRG